MTHRLTERRVSGSGLIDYLIYVAVAVAIWAAVALAWHHFVIAPAEARGEAAGVLKQAALDKPVIDRLTQDRDLAVNANASMQRDVDGLRKQVADSEARIDAADAQAKAAQAKAAAIAAAAAVNASAAAKTIAGLQATLAAAPSGEVCNGICAKARDVLRDLARDRLRDDP